jgi:hypothetical protein
MKWDPAIKQMAPDLMHAEGFKNLSGNLLFFPTAGLSFTLVGNDWADEY